MVSLGGRRIFDTEISGRRYRVILLEIGSLTVILSDVTVDQGAIPCFSTKRNHALCFTPLCVGAWCFIGRSMTFF
jgi:hypothetical protein